MPRLTLALVLVAGLLGGGLAASLLLRPEPGLDEAGVRAVVSKVLAEQPKAEAAPIETAAVDAETINPMIEAYLLDNPRVLEQMTLALQAEQRTAKLAANKQAIGELASIIYDDPDNIILGNPDGDVTIVELFDYNCGYCRQALPDLATLLAEDPNLKVVLKEFPILSQESVDAARVAVQVADADADYWTFHQALFTSRGKVTAETALTEAQKLGLNRVTLELGMNSAKVTQAIERSYQIARGLNITGTPSYIIGDEVIPGAVGIDQLRTRIKNMRACGATECES